MDLLPSPNVVVAVRPGNGTGSVRFHFPHRRVISLVGVEECVRLAPHVTKCLLGPPHRFLGAVLDAADHPLLSPFASVTSGDDLDELLSDLRDSLTVTPDESDFVQLWRRTDDGELPVGDRRVQRLSVRYAGQAPAAVNTALRLARTLVADAASGASNSLGLFADASHLGRVCKAATGRTPSAWRELVNPFH